MFVSSMPEARGLTERRRRARLPFTLPVRVRGREAGGTPWEEVASCLDASEGGLAIVMSHGVRPGQILHLSVPLPLRFRKHDFGSASYRIYGLVRSSRAHESRSRVSVMFLGPDPPRGSETLPSELYWLPSDRVAAARPTTSLLLRLEAEEAPGGVAQQENAVVERLTPKNAIVRVNYLPVGRGTLLTLEEIDGTFRCRAEVSIISIEETGHARLVLAILDGTIPDRMIDGDSPVGH
jgi:hypothetical protein